MKKRHDSCNSSRGSSSRYGINSQQTEAPHGSRISVREFSSRCGIICQQTESSHGSCISGKGSSCRYGIICQYTEAAWKPSSWSSLSVMTGYRGPPMESDALKQGSGCVSLTQEAETVEYLWFSGHRNWNPLRMQFMVWTQR